MTLLGKSNIIKISWGIGTVKHNWKFDRFQQNCSEQKIVHKVLVVHLRNYTKVIRKILGILKIQDVFCFLFIFIILHR